MAWISPCYVVYKEGDVCACFWSASGRRGAVEIETEIASARFRDKLDIPFCECGTLAESDSANDLIHVGDAQFTRCERKRCRWT